MLTIMCFDSILVRLKVGCSESKIMSGATFRFHTGSIKRLSLFLSIRNVAMFRFHTGSIKSVLRCADFVSVYEGFDSILVRLKEMFSDADKRIEKIVSIPYWFD